MKNNSSSSNNVKTNGKQRNEDWKRKKSAISLEQFAGNDRQYKRKLEKIEDEKKRKKLMDFKRKRLLSKNGFIGKKGSSEDSDTPLPDFLTVCVSPHISILCLLSLSQY